MTRFRGIERDQFVRDILNRCKRLGITQVNKTYLLGYHYDQLKDIWLSKSDKRFAELLKVTWPLPKPKPAPRMGDPMNLPF